MKTILMVLLLLIAGVCTAQAQGIDFSGELTDKANLNAQTKPVMWLVPKLSNEVYQVYTDGKDTNVIVTAVKLLNGAIEMPEALAKITGRFLICVDGLTDEDVKAIRRKIAAMRELNLPVR